MYCLEISAIIFNNLHFLHIHNTIAANNLTMDVTIIGFFYMKKHVIMKKLIINSMYKYNLKVIAFSPTQIIVLGFLSLIFIGSLLLSLPFATRAGSHIGFSKALFTSTSAVCVTGLVVVDTNTTWSAFGQTVILFLIQAGGLGIMASATLFSLIIGRRVSLKERLTIQESLNEFSLSGVVRMLKNILIATFTIELAGAFLLSFRLIPLYGISAGTFKSVFHSVSAFCNAGFDLFGSPGNEFTSLTPFANDPFVILPITLLFIIGGLGFVVWRDVVLIGKCKSFMLHTKVVLLVTSILILLGSILIFIFEYNNPATLGNLPLISKITNAYFQAVTPRTAGFNTLSLADMSDSSKFLLSCLCLLGVLQDQLPAELK